jgi:hypothetical protein
MDVHVPEAGHQVPALRSITRARAALPASPLGKMARRPSRSAQYLAVPWARHRRSGLRERIIFITTYWLSLEIFGSNSATEAQIGVAEAGPATV